MTGVWGNPAFVALVVIILLFSIPVVTFFDSISPAATRTYSSAYYYSEGSYHFEFFAYNQFGHGVKGIPFSMTVSNASSGRELANPVGSTDAEGFLSFTVNLVEGEYQLSGIAGPAENPFYWSNSPGTWMTYTSPTIPPGQIEGLGVPLTGMVDISKDLTQVPGLLVFFPFPGLSPQSPVSVYYKEQDIIDAGIRPLPESSMIRLGEATSSVTTFPLILQPTANSSRLNVQVELFSTQGTLLWIDTNQSVLYFYPIITQNSVDSSYLSFALKSFIPTVSILSLFFAFLVFGRERTSGTIQSVIVRPVTREGLLFYRFLGTLFLVLAVTFVGLLAADALGRFTTGFYTSWPMVVEAFLGALVASGFFLALTVVFSQATRRSGSVLLLGAGLLALFDFLWGSITEGIASYLGLAIGVSGYDRFLVNMTYLNPLDFAQLIQMYSVGNITSLDPLSPHSAAYYGIGLPSLTIAAIAWIVPLVLVGALLARRADY